MPGTHAGGRITMLPFMRVVGWSLVVILAVGPPLRAAPYWELDQREGGKNGGTFIVSPAWVGGSYFMEAFATAGGSADIKTKTGTYAPYTDPTTGKAVDSGNGVTASAQATMRVRPDGNGWGGLEVDPNLSFAKITPGRTTRGKARARWYIADPQVYERGVGPELDTFLLEVSLNEGFLIQAPLGESGASASYSMRARTNRPLYEELYSLDISMTGVSGPQIVFSSNPLLGLDDEDIANLTLVMLQAGFNGEDNSYSLGAEIPLFTARVPGIRLGERVELSIDHEGEVVAVPEPASLVLLGAGGIGFLRRIRRTHA
jgi:hypothetical protein